MPTSRMFSDGQHLGHYRIRFAIGAGGMGEVFLADDIELERPVALKVLPAHIAKDSEKVRRFVQEARAASALNHPNILTIHEFGHLNGTRFIVSEYIKGKTLRNKLETEKLDLMEILEIAIQIASALQAAHQAKIIHRDVKPENVMIRDDGFVKVLDFGLAKLTEQNPLSNDSEAPTKAQVKTESGIILGTVSYISPEQARGKAIDERTDIWSLGVVLYEMLTKRKPFRGETTTDVLAAIVTKEPKPPGKYNNEIPAELERIVLKSLRKDREERYQTIKELLIDLKDVKQELEFQNKLERTSQPNRENTKIQTLDLTSVNDIHTTSSAEYIVTEIKQHKRGFLVALIIIMLVTAGFSYWFYSGFQPNSAQIESIAILPFLNESGNAENEYLSDGMTESLISSLSQLPKLSVKARTTVFRYKGKNISPQDVGNELKVQAILLGRVYRRGDMLTLSLELVDTKTENAIWSEQYSRNQTDLVSLQSEIAQDVSRKLKTKLTGADEQKLAKNYTQNAEAYQLYLKGQFHLNRRKVDEIQKSIEYFKQAVAVDQNYALAHTGLAVAYSLFPAYGGGTFNAFMPLAKESALKALALDNQLAEAHTALGFILNFYELDFAGAEREFKTAIELNPNYALAHQLYGELMMHLGKQEESFAALRRALEIDPSSLIINRMYGVSLYYARQYDEAIEQVRKTIELDTSWVGLRSDLAAIYQFQGRFAESVEEEAKSYELSGRSEPANALREAFAKSGWEEYLRIKLNQLKNPYHRARIHASLGEKDKAFSEFEKVFENHKPWFIYLKVDPHFDSLKSDPKFQDLLKRVGFPI